MSPLAPPDLLPAADVARLFGRTLRTLSNWERAGLLIPIRIRRQRYFRLRDVEALLRGSAAAAGAQTLPDQQDSAPE
jgi:phage terminase Nu1 subunit (DNA packaging protein)